MASVASTWSDLSVCTSQISGRSCTGQVNWLQICQRKLHLYRQTGVKTGSYNALYITKSAADSRVEALNKFNGHEC